MSSDSHDSLRVTGRSGLVSLGKTGRAQVSQPHTLGAVGYGIDGFFATVGHGIRVFLAASATISEADP